MPYTILIFLTREAGMSHQEFKEYYETIQMPLLQRLGGEHFPRSHKRYYLQRQIAETGQSMDPAVDVDAVAEIIFGDETAFQAFMAVLKVEEAAKELRIVEDKFVDREKLKMVVVGDIQETKRQE
ncbi:hype protein [Mollisia scopiformis]|uniref:Hype protein n=1 Tax=Mollisia scopiformis TaxID=149040 RepID=A0A194X4N9_MOLSC|nr:hype protein [Mollisia scopiformis]KUJ15029.1 hype protein [Mollisia scopiformis]